MAKKYLDDTGMSYFWGKLKAYFQEKLVSGTNIKTINNTSVLGSGNIALPTKIAISSGASEQSLTTSLAIVQNSSTTINRGSFTLTNDGGWRCPEAGIVLVEGFATAYSLNTGDNLQLAVGTYRSGTGWVKESVSVRNGGVTPLSLYIGTIAFPVEANDIVYLRMANATATRGKVLNSRLMVEYI